MAGRPNKRAIPLAVKALADEQDMTELAYICSRLASGTYLAAIAREIGCDRAGLSTYVNALPGAKEALKEARSDGAHGMYEAALDVWGDKDSPLLTKEDIAIAKGKSDTLLWGAQRLGRTTFGEDKQAINVNVMNVGSLSLDAMRVRVLDHVTHARARLIEAAPQAKTSIDTNIVTDAIVLSDDDTTT